MSILPQNTVPYDGYSLAESPEGLSLFVNGQWNTEMESLVQSGRVHELVLIGARGFAEPNLEFLQPWPLSRLLVTARWITDLAPINRIAEYLTSLSLPATHPSAVGTFDVSIFPHLSSLSISWDFIRDQQAVLASLTDLYLESYSPVDLAPLAAAKSLNRLRMKQYPQLRSLEGLGSFEKLKTLGIFLAPKLADVSALRTAPTAQSIRELHFDTCKKIPALDDVVSAKNVQVLNIANSGDFPSLAPLTGMPELRELHLSESTRIVDGDLRPLLTLPKLQKLSIANRRHYSPQVGEIKRQLGIEHSSRSAKP
ncbi:hypothetical protein [Arthrobacter sp. Leaf137]|uniref:hypothetical protein n=1 Tax=Arthrobacter sp. Leaf137 TaxID=1736271 RepID=UPI000700F7D7|nr:hypothetical protein [Arthrobacter sp. Leaf137]KQQ80964.1 hypothetical protein ASF64_13085 [Arthrobacter sp. Leaf137]